MWWLGVLGLSRLRWAVSVQLAKAYLLGVGVPASRVIHVFNLNSGLVYRYLGVLEAGGIVERAGRGCYRVRDTEKARAWASFILGTVKGSGHEYFQRAVPEAYYYLAEPPSIEWLGFPEKTLVVVDEELRGRIRPPAGYTVVYTRMRGRRWRYDWDLGVSRASPEQALADLLSYDPSYPVEQYILLNLGSVNLDEAAGRASPDGLRRLATFLSFLRLATGKPIATRFSYVGLADTGVLWERLGEYTQLVFSNGADVERGV